MLSEVQKRKKETINIADQSSSTIANLDSTPQMTKEPIYDDVELTDKSSTIDLSENIAYECTKK